MKYVIYLRTSAKASPSRDGLKRACRSLQSSTWWTETFVSMSKTTFSSSWYARVVVKSDTTFRNADLLRNWRNAIKRTGAFAERSHLLASVTVQPVSPEEPADKRTHTRLVQLARELAANAEKHTGALRIADSEKRVLVLVVTDVNAEVMAGLDSWWQEHAVERYVD